MVFVFPEERQSLIGQALGQGLTGGFRQRLGSERLKGILGGDQSLDDQIASILGSSTILPEQRQQAMQALQQRQQQQLRQQDLGLKLAKEQRKQELLGSLLGAQEPQAEFVQRERVTPEGVRTDVQASAVEKFRPKEITNQQILAVASVDPQAANLLQRQKDSAQKVSEKQKDREFQIASKVLQKTDEQTAELVQKEQSLDLMVDAINSENLGFFSPDNIAELTGIEGLRTAKGAQFIASGKEFFLGSLRRAGPRPNQWIERQIQKMLPKMGRSREANLTVAEALKTGNAIERRRSELVDEIASEQEREFGFVRRSLGKEVDRRLKTFAEEEQKKLEANLRDILGEQKRLKVPQGTKLSLEKARFYLDKAKGNKQKAIQMAESDGFDITAEG